MKISSKFSKAFEIVSKPLLIFFSLETEDLLHNIEIQKATADDKSRLIKEDERQAERNAAEAKAIKIDCEYELQKVLPVLEEAELALETLNKNDVYEIKSMKSPPHGVKLVMEAVCILKGVKPTQIETNVAGAKVFSYWESAKKILGDIHKISYSKCPFYH